MSVALLAKQKIMKLNIFNKLLLVLAIGIFVFGVYRLWQVYESGQEWERKVEEAKEALNKSPKTPKIMRGKGAPT